jgi:hypothetical protein
MHDFGIFINLEPDEEEKAQLEQNIQVALQQNQIYLEDAIDIREVRNLKLANQFLKYRRKKKQEYDEKIQLQNIQAQAQANAEAAEKAAMAEMQKQQALAGTEIQIKKAESQFEMERMQAESIIKQKLLEIEYQYKMQLESSKVERDAQREKEIEDRKDKRTRITGSQQSEMIAQRKKDLPPTNFEENNSGQPITIDNFMPQ